MDNLISKEVFTYVEIQKKMMDLMERQSTEAIEGTAYYTKTCQKPSRSASGNNNMLIYTYCRKSGRRYKGHLYHDCEFLKQRLEDEKKPIATASTKAKVQEVVYSEDEYSEDEIIYNNTSAFAVRFSAELNSDAMAVYPTIKNIGQKRWIFDTGCTLHLSSYREDFETMRNQEGSAKAAGGVSYAVRGIGRIRITMVMPDKSVRDNTLEDAIYVPDMKDTRLLSWLQARKRDYCLKGSGDNLFILKHEEPILWAICTETGVEIQTIDDNPNQSAKSVGVNSVLTTSAQKRYYQFHCSTGHSDTTAN